MTDKVLVVQSDDFGMCHAVDTGIVRAFTEGILTQATCMVPCPWFDEAASLAAAHNIPVGMHCTLTAEWDHLRWAPLTSSAGLRGKDGTFHRTIQAAREAATVEECAAEIRAQHARFTQSGLQAIHLDCHMGVVHPDAYARVCGETGIRFLYPVGDRHFEWTSRAGLSDKTGDKIAWLEGHLDGLGPGHHLLVSHVATDDPELDAMAAKGAFNYAWTRPYRISDLDCLTSDRIAKAVRRNGIRLASCAEL